MDSKPSPARQAKIVNSRNTSKTVNGVYMDDPSRGHKRSYSQLREGSDALVGTTTVSKSIGQAAYVKNPQLHSKNYHLVPRASEIINAIGSESYHSSLYSWRKQITTTIPAAGDPILCLSNPIYGLPERLVYNFSGLGIQSIYPWQSKCLLANGLLGGKRNLVYTAPTGGGKSLVADVLMLKKVIDNPKEKAILVLPFVALVQEKVRWLRNLVEGVPRVNIQSPHSPKRRRRDEEGSIRVIGLFGGSKARVSWMDMDVAVCTIEKANALINSTISDGLASKLGVAVLDELHMLEDCHRGYLIEVLATKLLCLGQGIQIIGMSGTLPNTAILARWLNAKYYESKYRPIPIEEYLVYENVVYSALDSTHMPSSVSHVTSEASSGILGKLRPLRNILPSEYPELRNPVTNSVIALASEIANIGFGALIFCSSRNGCEADAALVSKVLSHGCQMDEEILQRRLELMGELRSTTTGLDHTLERIIPHGVAFHHAGLTSEERKLIAEAYEKGVIKVIVATCSLAVGINLPARRVILHGARIGRDILGPLMLRQMRGRAGRKGKDEIGETYLCFQKSDLEAVTELREAEVPNIESALGREVRCIERAILEIVATKLGTSQVAINEYVKRTLLLHQTMDEGKLDLIVISSIKRLLIDELIKEDSTTFRPTLLGEAVVLACLTPEDGLFIYKELKRAVQAFVMDGEMHVLYTCTPVQSMQYEVNWQIFRKEIENLDESGLRVLKFVGIKPTSVNKLAQGGFLNTTTVEDMDMARVYRRFYTALQLRDLCNEIPIEKVARKFDTPRGAVQNLAQICHGFAAGMIKFCERIGWGALAGALDHMYDRLRAGARCDLLALAQITYIKSRTARIFWENEYKTVSAVAAARVDDLVPILHQAQPRKLRLSPEDDGKYKQKLRLKAETIIQSANRVWERTARLDVEEE